MSQELLYTSAPSGLNPTDQGFCTVVCTQGMPRNLKEFLESLSGYRQADKPPHPVNFSHVVHSIAGKRYSVLSRVSDYEKDYSGRTNKLAHHVAFTMDELPPSGPAALLGTSLLKSIWDRQTRHEPHGPAIPQAAPYHGPCQTWMGITGDAGWAGVLAESAADGSNRPMYVIFPPGQNVLPLVAEALSVLPREQAWTTSFCTYFTKLPAGVDCLWRFVLDGSPEAQQARAASHARTIDLVELKHNRRRAPDGNPYVSAARDGRVMDSPATFASRGAFSPSAPVPMPTASGTIAATILQEAPPSPFASGTSAPASPFAKPFRQVKSQSKLPYILGGSAFVLLIGIGVLVYSIMTKDDPTTVKPSDSVATKTPQRKTNLQFVTGRDEQAQKNVKIEDQKTIAQPSELQPKNHPPVAVPDPMETKVKIEGPWDRTLKTRGNYLKIDPWADSISGNKKLENMRLAEIHVGDPSSIDLKIHSANDKPSDGMKDDAPGGFTVKVEDKETDDGPLRRWSIQQSVRNSVNNRVEASELGAFTLTNQMLTFLWAKDVPKTFQRNSLLYCILELSIGNESHKFRLTQPQAIEPLVYDLTGTGQKLDLQIQSNAVKNPQSLLLDLELAGVGEKPFVKKRMKVGEKAEFTIQKPSIKVGDPKTEFEIEFKYEEKKGAYLEMNAYTTRTQLPPITAREITSLETVAIGPVRESTVVTSFDRIKKAAEENIAKFNRSPQYKDGVRNLPEITKDVAELERDLQNASDEKERKEIQRQIGVLKGYINKINEILKRKQISEDVVTWADDMAPYFLELQKSARVRYTLYTEIQNEKLILSRTEWAEPPKKTDEPKR